MLMPGKGLPDLIGGVSAILWPAELHATLNVAGAYRCNGPENLKAETHYLFVN